MSRLHCSKAFSLLLSAAIGFLASEAIGQVNLLLEVDLSVNNQITINAANGVSAVTIEGSDTTGFYFDNFFNEDGAVVEALVSGNLTTTLNLTDDSPNLFRGSSTDPGLNIWSLSIDDVLNFESGIQAFTGTGTWDVEPELYAIFLSANQAGDIYFPADTVDDLMDATIIGSYLVFKGGSCAFGLGDVTQDRTVDLLDVGPFVATIGNPIYVCEADINQDGVNDLLDVEPFVNLLASP